MVDSKGTQKWLHIKVKHVYHIIKRLFIRRVLLHNVRFRLKRALTFTSVIVNLVRFALVFVTWACRRLRFVVGVI